MKSFIKKFGLLTIMFAAVTLSAATVKAQTGNEILIVADQMTSCRGIVAGDCLQVKRLSESQFTVLREKIDGFRYVAGFFYVLDVRRTNDGRLRLRSVLAREKSRTDNSPAPSEFFGKQWNLVELGGAAYTGKAFVRFDADKNSAGGNGGCNAFGGTLAKNGANLTISEVISTKMFCEQTSADENKFFSLLQSADAFEIRAGRLHLLRNKRTILVFR